MTEKWMKRRYAALAQPGKIGSLELPHRILMGSMHMGLEHDDDEQMARLCEFYRERALGGAALIITGGACMLPEGGGHMFVLTNPRHVARLAELPKAVHEVGGRIALQLYHAGRYAFSEEIGQQAVAPSPLPSRLTRETPREMTLEDIRRTIEGYANAARTAKEIGFDAIEIMGSEGYLLNQFLSPLTNHRTDEYGGDFARRMRLPIEVVEAVRQAVGPAYPIIFRMSGLDCMPGSTTPEETIQFAQALEKAGVDALNVGIGWHESAVPTVQQVVPRGGFAAVAAFVRQHVTIPVLAANRLNVPEVANELVADGFLDFIAPARPWLADAEFAKKILEGDRDGLNVCIACNQSCLDHTLVKPYRVVSCLVNPRAGYEALVPRRKASVKRRVAVVGGGPAGLEAARAAAERGHEVTLFERDKELGGQFRLASRIPGKDEFLETIRYYEVMLERLGVAVTMQTEPSLDQLAEFDDVIVAAGVKPRAPGLPGEDLPHVVSYQDLLMGRVQPKKRIVILGAGGIGCDVAVFLGTRRRMAPEAEAYFREQGLPVPEPIERSITMLARSDRIGRGIGRSTKWVVRQEMQRLGVHVVPNVVMREITPEGVRIERDGREELVPADQVVLCTGQESQDVGWTAKLPDRVRVHIVGGAKDSRDINAARAIREAWMAANEIE
ncbi:FAD-dependent oxidoreductase [Alicyclobacillus vulcanalis]|uniref:2,4-dienoyl-CoA reductase (NADPH2) n=1 Tax=Alicyclobacillus vulcanalis TaxID=252246 RepID=A0A1N7JZ71_9BACL|nr:NADPH-dependent 2,4-dienoyl-CoA reductase [Alicyclobacillus vulcanalis]SIS54630.1 2,4-dienoyl-CoA reductase (NADPH2) [Alicyclobacillus vulcanalis]